MLKKREEEVAVNLLQLDSQRYPEVLNTRLKLKVNHLVRDLLKRVLHPRPQHQERLEEALRR
jgi:hypothetical protein